jgi:RNA polymerase sigma factor (sigma-70 family)
MQPRLLKHPARLAGASLLRLQDDQRLVALAREGHDPAFAAIVDRYRGPLERYCARLLGPGRAEDAVQQAFVNAHSAMRATDQELALKPWLYRIAHNAAINTLRGNVDEGEQLDEERAGPTLTADVVELREQLRETLASIQALPTAQRDAILLRELEGRSHDEIGVALGVTAGGARQHLHRARVTLRAAASAITPYPLLTRVLSAAADGGARNADVISGAGLGAGAGAAKVAASVLAAGAIAGGAVTAHHHRTEPIRTTTDSAAVNRSTKPTSAKGTPSAPALVTAAGGIAGASLVNRGRRHGNVVNVNSVVGHRGGSGSSGSSGSHQNSSQGSTDEVHRDGSGSGGHGPSHGTDHSGSSGSGHGSGDTTATTPDDSSPPPVSDDTPHGGTATAPSDDTPEPPDPPETPEPSHSGHGPGPPSSTVPND